MTNDNKLNVCSCNTVHEDAIEKVTKDMINEDKASELANFFKVLGDYTRIKILDALSIKELCVCDISKVLNMSQSAISHQLRVLRAARLVKYRREGKEVFYSLDDEHVENVFGQGLEHIAHR